MSANSTQSHDQTFGEFIDQSYAPWAQEHLREDDAGALLKSQFSDWIAEPLSALTAWRIESWRRDRLEESSQSTEIDGQLRALDQCLRKAVEWRALQRNPLQDICLEKPVEYLIELFAGGTGHACLGEGWARVGVNWTGTLGKRAAIELPGIKGDTDYALKISVFGIAMPKASRYQRMAVTVNDSTIALVVCRGRADYEFFVPASLLNSRERTEIAIDLPDALRPMDHKDSTDNRFLALRLSKVELQPIEAIGQLSASQSPNADSSQGLLEQRAALQDMTSLGFNCEFGFVQRWVGAEPMSLFRWTWSPLAKLVVALNQRLAGLSERDALAVKIHDNGEFVAEDTVFGFRHHTFLYASEGHNIERVKRIEYMRVGVLCKTLLGELKEHNKLFVYHDADASTLEDIRILLGALNAYGNNTLLWIVTAPDESQAGAARLIEPGLIQGFVSGFQRGVVNPGSPYLPSWVAAACQAHKIWSALRQSQGRYVE